MLTPPEHVKRDTKLGIRMGLCRDRDIEIKHCDKNLNLVLDLVLNPLQNPVSSGNNSGKHCVGPHHSHLSNYL